MTNSYIHHATVPKDISVVIFAAFFYFRIYFYDTCYVLRLSSRKKWFSFFIKLYFCLRNYWQLLQCLLSFRISELLSFTWTKCPVSDWLSCTSMWIVWTYNESNQWKIMADRRQYRLQTMTFEIGIENQYSRYRYQDYSGIDWSLVSFFFLISIFLCLYSAILFFSIFLFNSKLAFFLYVLVFRFLPCAALFSLNRFLFLL